MFVDRPSSFAMDYNASLFQSMQEAGRTVQVVEAARDGSSPPRAPARLVRNRLTGSTPLVLHFNGGSKPAFAAFRDKLLSATKCVPLRAPVRVPGGTIPLQYVCPRHRWPLGLQPCR